MVAVRETTAPWYVKQAEFGGMTIVLYDASVRDNKHEIGHEFLPYYGVHSVRSWRMCDICWKSHWMVGSVAYYEGESRKEAEAAYAELERQLLAGELR